ncbi:hypothetical protein JOB18_046493 [Solea senegalensis]|uniref:Uncharacterized protein n=1 Tax=Solea senegalensis TaxID=28829 RepID=A0AAV6QT53_SOLSE|nr:hypothetical protein JOB18_046493 [Solea senegalensis]
MSTRCFLNTCVCVVTTNLRHTHIRQAQSEREEEEGKQILYKLVPVDDRQEEGLLPSSSSLVFLLAAAVHTDKNKGGDFDSFTPASPCRCPAAVMQQRIRHRPIHGQTPDTEPLLSHAD